MLSTSTWILIIIAWIIVDQAFMTPWEDHRRYKLYEARDKVTMEVLEDRLSEEDRTYQFVLDYLNFWLYYTRNDYDFSIVLKNIINIKPTTKRDMNKLMNQVNKNPVLQEALKAADRQSRGVMRIKGFVFTQIFLRLISIILNFILSIFEAFSHIQSAGHSVISSIKKCMEKTNKAKENYSIFNSMYKRI